MTKSTHSTITRRQALTGTAAGAAAIVAGAGPALAVDHPDAELLDLECQMEELLPRLAERMRAHEAAHQRSVR